MKYQRCQVCNEWIEEKWWSCQPCKGATPVYSMLHKFPTRKAEKEIKTVTESDNFVTILAPDGKGKARQQKFLCIGGRFNGQRKALIDVGSEYEQYNRSARSSLFSKALYIHKDIL